jgi:hypothetical protein
MSNNSGELISNFYTNGNDLASLNNRNGHNMLAHNVPPNACYDFYQRMNNEMYKSTNFPSSNFYVANNHNNNVYQKENESNINYSLIKHKSFPMSSTSFNDNHRKMTSDSMSQSIKNFNSAHPNQNNNDSSIENFLQKSTNVNNNYNSHLNNSFNSESSESPTSSSSTEPLHISSNNNSSNKYVLENSSLGSKENLNFSIASSYSNSNYQDEASLIDNNTNNLDENQLNQANKRPRSTFPFGKCKVCTDKATGIHYGKATCEGCKVN